MISRMGSFPPPPPPYGGRPPTTPPPTLPPASPPEAGQGPNTVFLPPTGTSPAAEPSVFLPPASPEALRVLGGQKPLNPADVQTAETIAKSPLTLEDKQYLAQVLKADADTSPSEEGLKAPMRPSLAEAYQAQAGVGVSAPPPVIATKAPTQPEDSPTGPPPSSRLA